MRVPERLAYEDSNSPFSLPDEFKIRFGKGLAHLCEDLLRYRNSGSRRWTRPRVLLCP